MTTWNGCMMATKSRARSGRRLRDALNYALLTLCNGRAANSNVYAESTSADGVAMSDMLRAAHHEAGHASVACAEGFKVQHIRLTEPDDGYVDYEGRSDTPLVARLSVVLAGHVAEGLAIDVGLEWRTEVEARVHEETIILEDLREDHARAIGFDSDPAQAAFLLRGLGDRAKRELFRSAWDRANDALAADWADVRAIAECLAGERPTTLQAES